MSKTQWNEKEESNEKALGENFYALGKKIAEKEGIDVSGNDKEKPRIAADFEREKHLYQLKFIKTGGVYP